MIVSPNFEGRSNKLGAVVHAQATRIPVLTSGPAPACKRPTRSDTKARAHCQRVSTAFIERVRARKTWIKPPDVQTLPLHESGPTPEGADLLFGHDTYTVPFALALFALFLSVWIVIPGPIIPLFVLTVAATELWPVLTVLNAVVLLITLRSHAPIRPVAIIIALVALLCTVVPPLAYALHGPLVPWSAFLMHLSERPDSPTVRPGAPLVLVI